MSIRDRRSLLHDGQAHIAKWCIGNSILVPTVVIDPAPTVFDTCAYYRDGIITIWPEACANLGMSGRLWSWPGYVVDRTPYGVVAHELGHHVDSAHGAAGGIQAPIWRRQTNDAPITSYCPNDNEWFAEIFRLFVTNPDLLKHIRPRMFSILIDVYPYRAELRDWQLVLSGSVRHLKASQNKINAVPKTSGKGMSL